MELLYLATFLVAFVSTLLSGIAGGGGSFILSPYWLISGMSPAQGATTGAFISLGMGGSSLVAFRGTGHIPRNKMLTLALLILTLLTSAVGPFFLPHIPTAIFKPILAVLTLISLPTLFIRRENITLSKRGQTIGMILLTILLLASSFITSSVFSILMAIVMSQLFNLSILQTTALRRLMGLVQSVVIFAILAILGNFVWQHALAGIVGGTIGSYLGTRFAIKRGEKFAKYALVVGGLVSSIVLVFS